MNDSEDRGNFTFQAHGMCEWRYEHVHLVRLYSNVGTDGINPSIPVLELMEYFTFQDKVISYMSDGGSNLNTCQDALEGKVTNTAIYRTQQTMFQQDCFAHAIQDA